MGGVWHEGVFDAITHISRFFSQLSRRNLSYSPEIISVGTFSDEKAIGMASVACLLTAAFSVPIAVGTICHQKVVEESFFLAIGNGALEKA